MKRVRNPLLILCFLLQFGAYSAFAHYWVGGHGGRHGEGPGESTTENTSPEGSESSPAGDPSAHCTHPLPEINFPISLTCAGREERIVPEFVTSPEDPVAEVKWLLDGSPAGNAPEFSRVFNSAGSHQLICEATTKNGCRQSVSRKIKVWSVPEAAFTCEPVPGENGYTYQFVEEAAGRNLLFEWSFGSTEPNPMVTFDRTDTQTVSLRVHSVYGCHSEVSKKIHVEAPRHDIQVVSIAPGKKENESTPVTIHVRNDGNMVVDQIELELEAMGVAVWKGTQAGRIEPGKSSAFEITLPCDLAELGGDYLCVKANSDEVRLPDLRPEDNVRCHSTESVGLELYAPSPSPGARNMIIRCATPDPGNIELRITDENGNLVRSMIDHPTKSGFHQYFIQISELPEGKYALTLVHAGRHRTVSFDRR